MLIFEKLRLRLGKDFGINTSNFRRLYPGHWQRSHGAWSWCATETFKDAQDENASALIGSLFSASDLVTAEKLTFDGREIFL